MSPISMKLADVSLFASDIISALVSRTEEILTISGASFNCVLKFSESVGLPHRSGAFLPGYIVISSQVLVWDALAVFDDPVRFHEVVSSL